jgi:hypothetical protein
LRASRLAVVSMWREGSGGGSGAIAGWVEGGWATAWRMGLGGALLAPAPPPPILRL